MVDESRRCLMRTNVPLQLRKHQTSTPTVLPYSKNNTRHLSPSPESLVPPSQSDHTTRFGYSLAKLPIFDPKSSNPDHPFTSRRSAQIPRVVQRRLPAIQGSQAREDQEHASLSGNNNSLKGQIRQAAQAGIQTPASQFPFVKRIQQSFGRHDISHTQAHVGSQAAESADANTLLSFSISSSSVAAQRDAHSAPIQMVKGKLAKKREKEEKEKKQEARQEQREEKKSTIPTIPIEQGKTGSISLSNKDRRKQKKKVVEEEKVQSTAPGPQLLDIMERLPNVKHEVLSQLEPRDLANMSQVSKQAKEYVSDERKRQKRQKLETLAQLLDTEPETVEKLYQSDPDFFETDVFGLSEDEIKENKGQLEYQILRLEKEMTQSSGGGKSGAWATSKIRDAANKIAKENKELFQGGQYTIHHKISRNQLHTLYEKMEIARKERPDDVQDLTVFLENLGDRVGTPNPLRALLNMPANLEVGPSTSHRIDDPGTGFDANTVPDKTYRRMTNRSNYLSQVDTMISQTSINFNKVANLLRQADNAHKQQAKGELLTMPLEEQWERQSNGKFKRLNR